jgi:hypothetical protein
MQSDGASDAERCLIALRCCDQTRRARYGWRPAAALPKRSVHSREQSGELRLAVCSRLNEYGMQLRLGSGHSDAVCSGNCGKCFTVCDSIGDASFGRSELKAGVQNLVGDLLSVRVSHARRMRQEFAFGVIHLEETALVGEIF